MFFLRGSYAMKMYLVKGGVARIPAGTAVALTAQQHARRAHSLDTAKTDRKTGLMIARVLAPVDFKTGETLGLTSIPKVLQQVLEETAAAEATAA